MYVGMGGRLGSPQTKPAGHSGTASERPLSDASQEQLEQLHTPGKGSGPAAWHSGKTEPSQGVEAHSWTMMHTSLNKRAGFITP